MVEEIIDLCLMLLLIVLAYSCGYEKGKGDAMEDEIEYIKKKLKKSQDNQKDYSEEQK